MEMLEFRCLRVLSARLPCALLRAEAVPPADPWTHKPGGANDNTGSGMLRTELAAC